MIRIMYLMGLVAISLSSFAQPTDSKVPRNRQRQGSPGLMHLYGKLVDSTGKGIGDASVLVLQTRLDTVIGKNKETLLKGISSQGNGDFNFEDLPAGSPLTIKISATGYKLFQQKIS